MFLCDTGGLIIFISRWNAVILKEYPYDVHVGGNIVSACYSMFIARVAEERGGACIPLGSDFLIVVNLRKYIHHYYFY